MTTLELVKVSVEDRLDEVFSQKPDLLSFLKNHERLPLLLNNVVKQVHMASSMLSMAANWQGPNQASLVKQISRDFADMFAKRAILIREKEISQSMKMDENLSDYLDTRAEDDGERAEIKAKKISKEVTNNRNYEKRTKSGIILP